MSAYKDDLIGYKYETSKEDIISVKHPNGFSGKLYGKSSMSIFDSNGKEIMHTEFRNEDIKTKEDLYKHLEDMPMLMDILYGNFDDILNDDDDFDV